jgi:2''-5'' RNA ligase
MKRIFVAVNISEKARQKAAEYICVLKDDLPRFAITWVRPEKLHLTLRFIGDCGDDELNKVTAAVQIVSEKIPSFSLNISGTGIFPTEKKARVLWLGVNGEISQMIKAKNLFEEEYRRSGLLGKRESLTPHLTIARIKHTGWSRDVINKHLNSKFEPVEFEVSEIVIYESRLHPTGSLYSVASRHSLT